MLVVSLLITLSMSLKWSRVSSLQFSYWLGQAGIVHIGLDQRVLTAVSEIRENKMLESLSYNPVKSRPRYNPVITPFGAMTLLVKLPLHPREAV